MDDIVAGFPMANRGPDRSRLFDIASEQSGYFRADQAESCGYSRPLIHHHAKTGRFIRVKRALYRLREYPSSPREDVLIAWLAVGKDVAVVSHESALDLLDLSDVIPAVIHVTAPRSRRYLTKLPGVKIHTTVKPMPPSDLTYREGMVVTSAIRTILDNAETGTAPDQIELAVYQAVERGLVQPDDLSRRAGERGKHVATLINQALSRASQ